MADTRPRTAHSRFLEVRRRLEAFEPRPGWRAWLFEFLLFGFKQGWACLFGALLLALLLGTHLFYPADAALARYDFLTLAAIATQIRHARLPAGDLGRSEGHIGISHSRHGHGTIQNSAWLLDISRGEHAQNRRCTALFWVYVCRSRQLHRAGVAIFDFRYTGYPKAAATYLLATAIYVNFFAHHWLPDVRVLLFAAMLWLFWRTRVYFTVWKVPRWMPLPVGWLLVALFIWIAENISTFSRAWTYPDQHAGWQLVSPTKLGAWYLLMYISFVLVAAIHRPRSPDSQIT